MPGISKNEYSEALATLQIELLGMARWLQHTGTRLVVLIEGRDAAGKGGAINAIASCLNPRQCRVVALPSPSERQKTQWHFQRYVEHLPAAGEIALFDRSWYNRAGVESVMGFCTPVESKKFLRQSPIFEKQLVDDGFLLFKYWLSVDQKEQEKRFSERASDPLKRWKLSPIDLQARTKYSEYGEARETMFKATHKKYAPWTVVDFNSQKRGRLDLIRHLLDHLPDKQLPDATIDLPPLGHKPQPEHFSGSLRPIKSRF